MQCNEQTDFYRNNCVFMTKNCIQYDSTGICNVCEEGYFNDLGMCKELCLKILNCS